MQPGHHQYDVIIIGGRIAGTVLASLLGERGHRVLVLDRATFPSDTLSTHFFRAPALRAFNEIGVYEEVQAVAPHLTVNYNVIDGNVFPEAVDRPEDFPFYMCVRRITLDDILARRVRRTPNVDMREGAVANVLLSEQGHITGVAWKESSEQLQASARVVVGADGVRSFVAKQVGAKIEQQEPVRRAMYYAYFRGIRANDGPAAEFHYLENNLAYCLPTDGALTMLATSVPINRFNDFKKDPEGSLMGELESMSALAPRLANGTRESPVRGSGSIPCYLRIPYGDGWALVGDSAMALDPWSGQGIDQASTHAVFLANYIGEFLDGQSDWTTAMQSYHEQRNEYSKKAYRNTSKFSADLRPMTRAALTKRGLT